MHEALEKFSKKLQENGETWKTVGDDTRDRLIEECVEEPMADYGNTIFQSSSRNQYRIIRVKRILKRTVWALQQQIRQGEFEPGEFEVSFSMEDSLSAINIDLSEHEKMRLRGRIDRVDLCETDDKVYVKIIDYKTGNTSLDLVALYYGVQLQLAVYLDAAVELEQKKHPELTEPPHKDNVVRLIKDVRFFLNTLNRAVGVMVDAGIGATVDRQENEDGITLTINIPHAKS